MFFLHEKSSDAHGKQQSSEADEALPVVEELVVLVVVVVVVDGVRGMLVVGMVDGDVVMGERAGDDKSKDTAEREGPQMENKLLLKLQIRCTQSSIWLQVLKFSSMHKL